MTSVINAVLDAELLRRGIYFPISIDLKKPHLAVFGSSGSGKTYASQLLLAKAVLNSAKLVVADFKGDLEFSFLAKQEHFYRFERVGLFFDFVSDTLLKNRQSGQDKSKSLIICFIDEMSAYFTMLEKKERDIRIRQLSRILMLGRSFNIHVWISQQRPDAEYFGKSRENIHNILLLGSFSKEVLNMLLSDDKDVVNRRQSRGKGYLISSGEATKEIVVPIYNIAKVQSKILEGMYKSSEAVDSE
ncbi:DUF87 domain-containing protein [Streptococcus sp. CF10-1]|uniref:type IV secretory system conjugative DNA transfer family protein n=1 Tax=Streptococcus sp. CF10-1 TaxID=2963162 RepID=UPI0020C83514|nr:DUF87 domain-containing protein [Streptococcus sp. CF10-1]